MSDRSDDFTRLDAPARATAGVASRPKALVYACVGLGFALSWLVLAAMARRAAEVSQGPGHELVAMLPDMPLPAFVETFFALCLTPVPAGASPAAEFVALTVMWFLMSLAMMLPSAAPMIRTYCEVADTAADRGEPVAHPLVLVAGYLSVWLAASAGLAFLAMSLRQAGAISGATAPLGGLAASAALALAGLYQFSNLKEACLEKCRNPFAVLFSRWSPHPRKIFRLGIEQGAWCLGCCWALMLVMFAVGLMNMFWMALIALFALVEKQAGGGLSTRLATKLGGGILLVWAAALALVSVA